MTGPALGGPGRGPGAAGAAGSCRRPCCAGGRRRRRSRSCAWGWATIHATELGAGRCRPWSPAQRRCRARRLQVQERRRPGRRAAPGGDVGEASGRPAVRSGQSTMRASAQVAVVRPTLDLVGPLLAEPSRYPGSRSSSARAARPGAAPRCRRRTPRSPGSPARRSTGGTAGAATATARPREPAAAGENSAPITLWVPAGGLDVHHRDDRGAQRLAADPARDRREQQQVPAARDVGHAPGAPRRVVAGPRRGTGTPSTWRTPTGSAGCGSGRRPSCPTAGC